MPADNIEISISTFSILNSPFSILHSPVVGFGNTLIFVGSNAGSLIPTPFALYFTIIASPPPFPSTPFQSPFPKEAFRDEPAAMIPSETVIMA